MSICDLADEIYSSLDKDLDNVLNMALDIEKQYTVYVFKMH